MNSKIDSDPKEIILLSYPPGGRLFVHTLPIIYEQKGRDFAAVPPGYAFIVSANGGNWMVLKTKKDIISLGTRFVGHLAGHA